MTIDRLLIICSVVELAFLACFHGVGCFTCFQWAAVILLTIKLVLVLAPKASEKEKAAKFRKGKSAVAGPRAAQRNS